MMAENLRYETKPDSTSYCFENDSINCDRFGRLYPWKAAKKACPNGWRLLTKDEWTHLIEKYGSLADVAGREQAYKALISGGISGMKIELGGYRSSSGRYSDLNKYGYYWCRDSINSDKAHVVKFNSASGTVAFDIEFISFGHSVLCIQEERKK